LKQFDEALADLARFETFATKETALISMYVLKSLIEGDRGHFDKSVEQCNLALKADPKNVIALINRAHSYCALGQLDKAHADLKSAQALRATPREAFHLQCARTQLALKEGDHKTALTVSDSVLQTHPNTPCACSCTL
jgi:tetratricopeptide (TPR) repeat protein